MKNWTFEFEAGWLVAHTVLFCLRKAAALLGLEWRYVKGPGLLSAEYVCTVTGETEQVERYKLAVANMYRAIDATP